MRGMASIANAVAPVRASASSPSGLPRGLRKPTNVVVPDSFESSPSDGGATLTTTSAPHGSPIVAPASVNSSSGTSAATPAPPSTTTSWPFATSLRTTSGTRATRRSPSAVSFGTPILIRGGGPYTNRHSGRPLVHPFVGSAAAGTPRAPRARQPPARQRDDRVVGGQQAAARVGARELERTAAALERAQRPA